jgi:hypothetical protein
MPIEKEPFVPYRDEKERAKDKRKVIPVSLNNKEMKWLDPIKEATGKDNNSTALKHLARIGYNVIHYQLGEEFFKALSRKDK